MNKTATKQTAIPWIGEIPEGWEVRKLKTVCKINPSKEKEIILDKEVVFLPMEKVGENRVIDQSIFNITRNLISGFTYFERGDVIFAKITPCFENGKGALLDNLKSEYGFGSTEFHVLRSFNNIFTKEYLNYIVTSDGFMKIGETFMQGSAGQKRVTTEFVKEFQIPLPPLPTQTAIANF